MSLILEALKKSERQRRLGESPSLGSPIMVVRRRRSVLPVLVALIAIGLVALWWMRRESAAPEVDPSAATNAQVTAATKPAPPPAASVPRANPAPPADQKKAAVSSTVADRNVSQNEKLRNGELVAADAHAGRAATIKESEPVSAADPTALAVAMADATKTQSPPVQDNVGASQPVAHSPESEIKAAPAAPPVAPAAPVASAEAAGSTLKLMWELPLATRRSLPDIKLSMHVYAAEPKQRFVIINGERRAEGDEFDKLKLIEIRNDGVVFEHEGVQFLYPRGGR